MKAGLLSLCTLFIIQFSQAQTYHLQVDFNNSSLPNAWTNTASSGTANWSFGLNGSSFHPGNNNLSGTAMAYFDDDALGSTSLNNTAVLESSSFDNSTDSITFLEFDYNFRQFNGISDEFKVEVYDGTNWNVVLLKTTNDCGNWVSSLCIGNFPHAKIDISTYKNTNCKVRFTYHDGNDWGWYVGLDNVEIWSPYQNDLSVDGILPLSSLCSSSDSLSIIISNKGIATQSNFPIRYSLNNGSPVSAIYTDSLMFQETDTFTFPALVNYAPSTNTLRAYSDLGTDQDNSNDSLNTTVTVPTKFNLPYQEDFEGSTQEWTSSGTNSSWQIGVPNTTRFNSAASGSNAAVTNLSGNHNALETSYLTSPCIYVGPTITDIRISFDLIYRTETSYDYCWLEISYDGGITFSKVLDNSNYSSLNWYNNTNSNVWEGIGTPWNSTSVVMTNIPANSSVKFRFAFVSDGSTQLDGIGVDNFVVSELSDQDLSINRVAYPGNNSLCGLNNENIVVEIENFGTDTITAATLYYQVNGGIIYTDNLTQALLPGARSNYIFSQRYNFSSLSNASIKVWSSTPGDSISLNDTATAQITNTVGSNYSVPYNQDFDSMTVGGNPSGGWSRNPATGFATWIISNGGTPSLNTGAFADATGGNFVFLETSTTYSQDPTFESPCINLPNNPKVSLTYAYHMYGATMGTLFVDVYDGNQWVQVDQIVGQQQLSANEPWRYRAVSLSQFLGRSIKVRFRGRETGTNGFQSDMAVDDVRIDTIGLPPLYLRELEVDSASCVLGGSASVAIQFSKINSDTLSRDSLSFDLIVNDTLLSTEFLSQSLSSSYIDTVFGFNFRPTINTTGPIDFKVRMNLQFNGQLIRDSLIKTISYKIDQLPYDQGFENMFSGCFNGNLNTAPDFIDSEGWYIGPSQLPGWHITDTTQCNYTSGTTWNTTTGPSSPHGGSAHAYWDQNTTGPEFLYTPCFDLSKYNQATLEFWVNRYDQTFRPMGALKLELFQNGQWVQISRYTTVTSNPAIWTNVSIDISSYLSNDLTFRFRVDSAFSSTHTSIDDFKIYDPLVTGVSPLKTHTPTLAVYPNPNNGQFTITVPEELINEQYLILDLSGKTLKRANFKSNQENLRLDAQKGVYILVVPGKGIQEKVVVY